MSATHGSILFQVQSRILLTHFPFLSRLASYRTPALPPKLPYPSATVIYNYRNHSRIDSIPGAVPYPLHEQDLLLRIVQHGHERLVDTDEHLENDKSIIYRTLQ